jgi:hypothetical protein
MLWYCLSEAWMVKANKIPSSPEVQIRRLIKIVVSTNRRDPDAVDKALTQKSSSSNCDSSTTTWTYREPLP